MHFLLVSILQHARLQLVIEWPTFADWIFWNHPECRLVTCMTSPYWLSFLVASATWNAQTDTLRPGFRAVHTVSPQHTSSCYLHQWQDVLALLLLQQTISSKSVLSLQVPLLGDDVEAQAFIAFHPGHVICSRLIWRILRLLLRSGVRLSDKHLPEKINFGCCSSKGRGTGGLIGQMLKSTHGQHGLDHNSFTLSGIGPKKPGATLMQVWFSATAATLLWGLYSLHVQLHAPTSAHIKNSKHWQSYHCLDAWKYDTHWQDQVLR